jgi:DNA invertase Pin-like site-specific DNA recombinase
MQTLNAQEATLRALAAARGATVCGAWLEIGPGPGSAYHAMIQHLRGNGCARVAIYDLGRLTRDPNEFQLVMELLAELGIGLTLADGTDLDTADDPVLRLRLYGFAPRKARLAPGSNW